MFFNKKIILASKSRSRAQILKKNNIKFYQKKPKAEEEEIKKQNKKVSTKKLTEVLATAKARSIEVENTLIVGSDTAIDLGGETINKAKNMKEAKEKIIKLSGREHNIFSSVACFYNNKLVWKTTQKTTVKIRKISKKEAKEYINTCGKQILSSVGCYQIEKNGPNIIERIDGDFFNVMGFPLFPFLKFLKKFNMKQ